MLHVGQLLNVPLPAAIYSVALPGLSSCLTLLLELTFAGFLPATIHLLDVLLLTYSSNPLRIFMAAEDFIPAVKGIGYTPGSGGFANIVPTGNSAMSNAIKVAGKGGSGATSYWWNAGQNTTLDIYNMAHGSIAYANAARLQTQADRAGHIAPKFGMNPLQFQSMVKSGNYEGSIVFGRLPKSSAAGYVGGESVGEGVQSVEDVVPYRTMKNPSNVEHHAGGARLIRGDGSKVGLNKLDLETPEFHDWMKGYAKNLKETIGENAILPKGTQELLDAPTFAEGNASLGKYLETKYPGKFVDPKLTSIMPNAEGILSFKHGVDGSNPGKVMRSSIDENLVRESKSVIPQRATQGLSIGSPVEMKTIAGAPRRMPIQRATAATQARIASSVAMETVEDNVGRVVQRSGATSRLLGAASEASAHVAGGAAKSGLLRDAAAAATILGKRL